MEPYTIIPNKYFDNHDLNPMEKLTLFYLIKYKGKSEYAYPSLNTLKNDLGYSHTRYVINNINNLIKKGYVKKETVKRRNRYYIIDDVQNVPNTKRIVDYNNVQDVPNNDVQNVPYDRVQNVPTNNKKNNKNKKIYIYIQEFFELTLGTKINFTDKRIAELNLILKKYDETDMYKVLENIKKSDYLLGKENSKSVNIDWLLNENNFTKVLEGKYSNRDSHKKSTPSDIIYLGEDISNKSVIFIDKQGNKQYEEPRIKYKYYTGDGIDIETIQLKHSILYYHRLDDEKKYKIADGFYSDIKEYYGNDETVIDLCNRNGIKVSKQ